METGIPKSCRIVTMSTDPTYKEWKQLSNFKLFREILEQARILPTRNGNQRCTQFRDRAIGARILPTRNGNELHFSGNDSVLVGARILPTRNGNQSQSRATSRSSRRHGSYLQGMETEIARKNIFSLIPHGSYLQGMETSSHLEGI